MQTIAVMLEELMQKLKKLEDKVTERERGYVQQGQQTCRPTQKQFQEVVCHKCKQPGHYAHGCASSIISRRSLINQEVRPPVDQVCDAVLNDNTQFPNTCICLHHVIQYFYTTDIKKV